MRILILAFLLPFLSLHTQELHHQMLSSQGTSKELPNGVFVSQTIGQQSVIGNYTRGVPIKIRMVFHLLEINQVAS